MNTKNEIRMSYFQVGTIVKINASFLNEPAGVLGYVYENYDTPSISGISIITENGVDLGGFSLKEQSEYLEYVGDTGMVYIFKNVIQLDRDFDKIIKPLFHKFNT